MVAAACVALLRIYISGQHGLMHMSEGHIKRMMLSGLPGDQIGKNVTQSC